MSNLSKLVAIVASAFCIFMARGTQSERKLDTNDQHTLEKHFTEMESRWAEATGPAESSLLEEILADDFLGTDTRGEPYTKAQAIARAKSRTRSPNHLDKIKIRFFGDDLVIIHGSESSVDGTKTVVWTDVWLKRNGRWQNVAAQDMLTSVAPRTN